MANISDSSFFKKCQGILQKVKWILEFHELSKRETKNFKSAITKVSLDKSHVHVLLYGVKLNGEIDIVQFILTRCVVYFSE